MDVELYVYDLSKGLARLMSMGLVGIQIDAVYHTAIVFGGVEYFYGAGIQTCYPGATHHGAPMEIVKLGRTDLPMDVIQEYLQSLQEVYTPESYDLFEHNCNNFSHDFAMFLVGKGIPEHITSLPQTVLNTPFGQMLKPQIDASMRTMTQQAVPPERNPMIQAEMRAAGHEGPTTRNEVAEQAVIATAQQAAAQAAGPSPKGTPRKLEVRSGAHSNGQAGEVINGATPHNQMNGNTEQSAAHAKKHPRKIEVRGDANGSSSESNAPPKKQPRKIEMRDHVKEGPTHGSVYNVTQPPILDGLLSAAKESCAVIFFTSSTCAPCKLAYPTYDALAAENPKVPFIKVDINVAREIGMRYSIRATPTFMTFFKGDKENEWSGANPSQLRANVDLLIQRAFPVHPHLKSRLPTLQFGSLKPVTFSKIPPLDKLTARMGDKANDPAVKALTAFISARSGPATTNAPLPDLPAVAKWLRGTLATLPKDVLFTSYDLLRCALLDHRFSSWMLEESGPDTDGETLLALLSHVLTLMNDDTCPYNLRLVTIQLAANLSSSPIFSKTVLSSSADTASDLASMISSLSSHSLLAEPEKPAIRSAAASLASNMTRAAYRVRREEEREALPESAQVELAASLLELLGTEAEAAKESHGKQSALEAQNTLDMGRTALTAFGYLIYCAPAEGELRDLCGALDARATVLNAGGGKEADKIRKEIADGLLGGEW